MESGYAVCSTSVADSIYLTKAAIHKIICAEARPPVCSKDHAGTACLYLFLPHGSSTRKTLSEMKCVPS